MCLARTLVFVPNLIESLNRKWVAKKKQALAFQTTINSLMTWHGRSDLVVNYAQTFAQSIAIFDSPL